LLQENLYICILYLQSVVFKAMIPIIPYIVERLKDQSVDDDSTINFILALFILSSNPYFATSIVQTRKDNGADNEESNSYLQPIMPLNRQASLQLQEHHRELSTKEEIPVREVSIESIHPYNDNMDTFTELKIEGAKALKLLLIQEVLRKQLMIMLDSTKIQIILNIMDQKNIQEEDKDHHITFQLQLVHYSSQVNLVLLIFIQMDQIMIGVVKLQHKKPKIHLKF
jgi:hypothetical protein